MYLHPGCKLTQVHVMHAGPHFSTALLRVSQIASPLLLLHQPYNHTVTTMAASNCPECDQLVAFIVRRSFSEGGVPQEVPASLLVAIPGRALFGSEIVQEPVSLGRVLERVADRLVRVIDISTTMIRKANCARMGFLSFTQTQGSRLCSTVVFFWKKKHVAWAIIHTKYVKTTD